LAWADIKLAGSLSPAVSLPTMLIGFARYSQDRSFAVQERNRLFALIMAVASIVGAFIGGRLVGLVPSFILLPLLALILLISAVKVWRHRAMRECRAEMREAPHMTHLSLARS
jgi:uncharacterized membrane protein YfcA